LLLGDAVETTVSSVGRERFGVPSRACIFPHSDNIHRAGRLSACAVSPRCPADAHWTRAERCPGDGHSSIAAAAPLPRPCLRVLTPRTTRARCARCRRRTSPWWSCQARVQRRDAERPLTPRWPCADALASSITDWLSRPDESAPQGGYSGRHLRSGAKRLLGSLRERSRGFPAEPLPVRELAPWRATSRPCADACARLQSTATVVAAASSQHLSPRARLALADALREGPPEAPAPQYSGSEARPAG